MATKHPPLSAEDSLWIIAYPKTVPSQASLINYPPAQHCQDLPTTKTLWHWCRGLTWVHLKQSNSGKHSHVAFGGKHSHDYREILRVNTQGGGGVENLSWALFCGSILVPVLLEALGGCWVCQSSWLQTSTCKAHLCHLHCECRQATSSFCASLLQT